jgi:hypothetical protein
MSEWHADDGRDPGKLFRELKNRPTPELDCERLWNRVAAGLTPRRASWWQMVIRTGTGRPTVVRLAYAAVGVAALAIAAWAGIQLLGGGPGMAPEGAGQLAGVAGSEAAPPVGVGATIVRLAPPLPDAPQSSAQMRQEPSTMSLDVRLVRGFSGPVPADVQATDALAAGGADMLADVRPEVASLPFEQYGLLGRWEGELAAATSMEAGLSQEYALSFATVDRLVTDSYVELTDVHLVGKTDVLVAASLRLEPGRLYLLGVIEPGEEAPAIILAIRAEAVPADPGPGSSTP